MTPPTTTATVTCHWGLILPPPIAPAPGGPLVYFTLPPPPRPTLFPYTTLFRSEAGTDRRPWRPPASRSVVGARGGGERVRAVVADTLAGAADAHGATARCGS